MAAHYVDCVDTPPPTIRLVTSVEEEVDLASTLRMLRYDADVSDLYTDSELTIEPTWVDEPLPAGRASTMAMVIGAVACFAWGGALAFFTLGM